MDDHSEAIAQFISVTGAGHEQAQQYLSMTNYQVQDAVAAFYQAADDESEEDTDDAPQDPATHAPQIPSAPVSSATPSFGGGRRLGDTGTDEPTPSIPSSSAVKPVQPKKKLMSLKDLRSEGHAGHGHGSSADDDDDDKEQEFYAGGDKSGLAVQDPSVGGHRDQIQRLMNTARRGGGQRPPPRDGGANPTVSQNHFGGQGQTLGGDDVESRLIPATVPSRSQRAPELVERILHLWEDGFSIDDGNLYRYDDPANRAILDMINSGSAPMDLMNVQDGQAVDVKLDDHRGQKYVQPKKVYKPFEGSGNRLGSPTAGPPIVTSSNVPVTAQSTAPSAIGSAAADDSQPTVSLQIRLADGTRLPSRFNTTQTIADVYAFVDRAISGQQRPYVMATTFPTRDLTDKDQVLGEMAEFKRGGVVVQKWV